MFQICLFCHSKLGVNEDIEALPIGRRLAFDCARGRLWVVCTHCARWNLTPFEERWEALEECERRFRGSALRVHTDHIGLAQLRSGLELVRVGPALRPEMAAWRYGPQLLHRRRRAMPLVAAQAAADTIQRSDVALALINAVGYTAAVSLLGPASLYLFYGVPFVAALSARWSARRQVASLPHGERPLIVRRSHLRNLRIEADHEAEWRLVVPHDEGHFVATGQSATRTLGGLLARANRIGASEHQVRLAVAKLEYFGTPARLFEFAAQQDARRRPVLSLGYEQRLALEMAAHEDFERRAIETDLRSLESAWREAEEIAAIADNLLVPQVVEAWLARHRANR